MSALPQLPLTNEQILQQLSQTLDKLGITQKYGQAAIHSLFFNPANPKAVNNALLLEAALLGNQLPREFLVSQSFDPPTLREEAQIQTLAFSGLGAKVLRVDTAPGVSLQAWYIKPQPGKSTILFSNGADGDFIKSKELITQLKSEGYGVLTYQFRGYGAADGGSTGKPSEEGLYSDLKALSRFLAEGSTRDGIAKTPYSRQVLMGYSLGGDVSAHVAAESHRPYQGLVLINSPRSIEDAFRAKSQDTDVLVREIVKPFQANIIATEQKLDGAFDISDEMAHLRTPTLFVQGGQDKLALPEIARELFRSERFPVKSFFLVPDADHGSIISDKDNADAVSDRIDSFLSRHDLNKVIQDMAGYCDKNEAISSYTDVNNPPTPLPLLVAGQQIA